MPVQLYFKTVRANLIFSNALFLLQTKQASQPGSWSSSSFTIFATITAVAAVAVIVTVLFQRRRRRSFREVLSFDAFPERQPLITSRV